MKAGFTSPLRVEEVDERAGTWQLLQPLAYDSAILGRTITVPAGFVTDFASVPRLPFVYLAEGGRGDKAAVVHDWLYSCEAVDRATADSVLREALLVSGYGTVTAALFYTAVRLGGGSHWRAPNLPQTMEVAASMTMTSAVMRAGA